MTNYVFTFDELFHFKGIRFDPLMEQELVRLDSVGMLSNVGPLENHRYHFSPNDDEANTIQVLDEKNDIMVPRLLVPAHFSIDINQPYSRLYYSNKANNSGTIKGHSAIKRIFREVLSGKDWLPLKNQDGTQWGRRKEIDASNVKALVDEILKITKYDHSKMDQLLKRCMKEYDLNSIF